MEVVARAHCPGVFEHRLSEEEISGTEQTCQLVIKYKNHISTSWNISQNPNTKL